MLVEKKTVQALFKVVQVFTKGVGPKVNVIALLVRIRFLQCDIAMVNIHIIIIIIMSCH